MKAHESMYQLRETLASLSVSAYKYVGSFESDTGYCLDAPDIMPIGSVVKIDSKALGPFVTVNVKRRTYFD